MSQTTTKTAIGLLFLLINFAVQAQTWTGSVSSNWDLAANWDASNVPSNTGDVIIPGTGVTNWPVLNSDIIIGSLILRSGSQIDVKGHAIGSSTGHFQDYTFLFQGSTINNSQPATEINIGTFSGGNVLIENCTFNGNAHITLTGIAFSRMFVDNLSIRSNHFVGNTKITESYQMPIGLGNSYDVNGQVLYGGLVFDGDLEFERTWTGSSSIFNNGGATINGNFLYRNLAGTIYYDPAAGAFDWAASIGMNGSLPYTQTTVSGNVDIIVNGSVNLADLSYGGVGKLTFVGENNGYLGYTGSNPFLYDISMEKTGSGNLSLKTPLGFGGQLSFTGGHLLTSAVNSITFLDGAVASGASDASHITGPVRKTGNDGFTFPIGSGSKFNPVSITAPSNATDGFSAEYISDSPTSDGYNPTSKAGTLNKVYDGGYWDIKRLVGSSNVSVSLGYNIPAGNITDQSKLRVAHWNGSIWEDLGNGGTSGSLLVGTVTTASGVTSFSPFTIATADASNPLPVTLVSFSVQKENQTALLAWSTTEELNSDRFEIEHSENAKNWQKIGEVKAAGESKSQSQYHFTHTTPLQGINYYRLKMIDLDNTFAYSKIESLKLSSGTETVMYPNPVSNRLFVKTASGTNVLSVALTNTTGVDVMAVNAGDLQSGIDLSKLSAGVYFVKITLSNGQKETHKIFVSR